MKLGEGLGLGLAEEEDADTGLDADNYASGDGDETSSEEEESLLLSAGLPASGRCAGEGGGGWRDEAITYSRKRKIYRAAA